MGQRFFAYYNTDHHHSRIGMLTPASVYFGTDEEIIERRQQTIDAAFSKNPGRFRNGRPIAQRPQPAWINKPNDEAVQPSSIV